MYGLISRLTAKHSSVLACELAGGRLDGTNRVFATALRSPKGALTLLMVNDAPCDWRAHLNLRNGREPSLYQYRVTSVDRDQPMLRINPVAAISPETGVCTVTLPPMSLVILSSFHLVHTAPGVAD